MKKALLFFFLVFSTPLVAQDARYVIGTDDVPLMEGLTMTDDDSLAFDTLEGRLVQAVAFSDTLSERQIVYFYDQTLPALGWTGGKKKYARDGEKLQIDVLSEKPTTVQFKLISFTP